MSRAYIETCITSLSGRWANSQISGFGKLKSRSIAGVISTKSQLYVVVRYGPGQRITNRADGLLFLLQWSKAVYAYGVAALLVQLGGEANKAEGLKLMTEVPKLRQRIAGKSIPLEKFVARKARKCEAQGGRLLLPGP